VAIERRVVCRTLNVGYEESRSTKSTVFDVIT
jgi:hypothetical protein